LELFLLLGLFVFFTFLYDRFVDWNCRDTFRIALSILYSLDFFARGYTDVRTKKSKCLTQTGTSYLKSDNLFEQ
jgi:hypothetical protein